MAARKTSSSRRTTSTRRTPRTPSSTSAHPRGTPGIRRGIAGLSYESALALQAAKSGDDTQLLDYQPTDTSNPPRPRTLAAGYDRSTRTLRVRWRDGTGTEYYDVPPDVWRRFERVRSPGKFVNRVLNNYSYTNTKFEW